MPAKPNGAGAAPLLEVDHLVKHFPVRRGLFGRVRSGVSALFAQAKSVGELSADVDRIAAFVQKLQVVGEGLPPAPGHPLEQGRARNILDCSDGSHPDVQLVEHGKVDRRLDRCRIHHRTLPLQTEGQGYWCRMSQSIGCAATPLMLGT